MRLRRLGFPDLPDWAPTEFIAAWPAYIDSCRALTNDLTPLRTGAPPTVGMAELARRAQHVAPEPDAVSNFFLDNFEPFEVLSDAGTGEGFVTGYYEPELDGSERPDDEFSAPVLARPDDLIDMRGSTARGWNRKFEGARRAPDGRLSVYPTRSEIENGILGEVAQPVVWLRDHVEVFFCQVQGSARLRLKSGERRRLVYAGRNGRPYTSIGRLLIMQGEIAPDDMSLARCKAWLRANGLELGERGRAILQSNESYVFFNLEPDSNPGHGPIGAQGVPLTPMRSIAVDRTIWPYCTPIWIGSDLSSAGLGRSITGRLVIAQDTGSAIVGAARGDLFIGSGDRAGEIAGLIRHAARFFVLLPKGHAQHAG